VLRRRATVATKPDGKREDKVRVARILASDLGETDEAIAAWREVEEEFGDTKESTTALGALYRSARRYGELAQLFARAASREDDRDEKSRLLRELGDVQRENLDATDKSIESYRGALEVLPTNSEARAGLRILLARPETRAAAALVLLGAYRVTDEWA